MARYPKAERAEGFLIAKGWGDADDDPFPAADPTEPAADADIDDEPEATEPLVQPTLF